jgi:hypothetical protein
MKTNFYRPRASRNVGFSNLLHIETESLCFKFHAKQAGKYTKSIVMGVTEDRFGTNPLMKSRLTVRGNVSEFAENINFSQKGDWHGRFKLGIPGRKLA